MKTKMKQGSTQLKILTIFRLRNESDCFYPMTASQAAEMFELAKLTQTQLG
jgi:hypothetical protein